MFVSDRRVTRRSTAMRFGRACRWSAPSAGGTDGCLARQAVLQREGTRRTKLHELAGELRRFPVRLEVVGDTWLFPRTRKDAPWPTEAFW